LQNLLAKSVAVITRIGYHQNNPERSMQTMPETATLKTISARVSPRLHEATTRLARLENKSVNEIVAEALTERVRIREEQELYDAFTLLGQDEEETDVEFALAAQAEVSHVR
jgi:hypothetical protein